ncbi:hypothetical protein DL96DRAFT_1625846 [Flagelloscypha sp. PMI_526]|nr:hypothetical protein DL96DRAFT_1625846 [Flagelloscypha sp. PMI_526]
MVATIITLGTVFVHHLLSFFVTYILHRPTDLLLCALEGPLLMLSPFFYFDIWGYGVGPCIMLVHFSIFVTRIWDCLIEPSRSCWEKFDLINSSEHIIQTPRISLLLGRKAWHELSLKGEHFSVKSARAVLALLIMGAFFIFTGTLIKGSIDISSHQSAFKHYTELYDGTQDLEQLAVRTTSELLDDATTNTTQTCWEGTRADDPMHIQKCHADTEMSEYRHSSLCKHVPPGPPLQILSYCEIRVEIDFRFFDRLEYPVLDLFKAVKIQMVGENVTASEISGLPSITLRKHDNLVGDARVFLWESFRTSGFNTFGYGGSFKRFPVAEFLELRPDELYTKGDISSLRIFTSVFPTDSKLQIVREYNENSILSIFVDIGGLWTFVNGLFGLVFGGSLLYFLFGIKPLSRFGIVHLLSQERFRRGTRENYPLFFEEGGQPGQSDAGVVAFIREHLLGVISDDQFPRSKTSSSLDHPQNDCRDYEKFSPEGVWTSTGYNSGEGGSTERIPLTPRRLIIPPS